MAEFVEKTLFERALLASRLVDPAELVAAAQRSPTDPPGYGPVSDERIASRLIKRGLLNAWQAEQLRAGRTKFTLGPYLVVDAIGKGGMGHLFKGRHALLDRIEAIKVLPKSRSTPQSIASFQHEIRAQAQLDHPNLVRVSFAGRDGETHFLVTEFVPGVDLRRLVRRRGRLTSDQAASVVLQTAEALEYAHRRGLVHRDVKPGNLLVQPDGVVKVTDLGLAWRLEDSFGPGCVGGGKIVGTCDYIAPESIRAPDQIMPVSDVYSLGCTLYYALTGKVPYPGGNAASKMRRHLNDDPIDLHAFNPDLPAEMTSLVTEMMQRDHHRRTPSASVVAQRLRPLVRDDTAQSLSTLVHQSELPGGSRSDGAASGAGDIGETMVSLSGADLGTADPATQASQGTDPIASATEDTPPLSDRRTAGVSTYRRATDRSPDLALQPPGEQSVEPRIARPKIARPKIARQSPFDRAVRFTVAGAVGATLAIAAAAALRWF